MSERAITVHITEDAYQQIIAGIDQRENVTLHGGIIRAEIGGHVHAISGLTIWSQWSTRRQHVDQFPE